MKVNLNDYVRVQLTERGREIAASRDAGIHLSLGLPPATPKVEDADGWSRWQLWDLMQCFGPHLHLGATPPFSTAIDIPEAHRDRVGTNEWT